MKIGESIVWQGGKEAVMPCSSESCLSTKSMEDMYVASLSKNWGKLEEIIFSQGEKRIVVMKGHYGYVPLGQAAKYYSEGSAILTPIQYLNLDDITECHYELGDDLFKFTKKRAQDFFKTYLVGFFPINENEK